MANIEQKNIESSAWWAEAKINRYTDNLKGKEIGKQETEQDRQKADELLKDIEGKESLPKGEKKTDKEDIQALSPDIKKSINQLNRPEAKAGIAQSYVDMDTTIKNSKHEKWIGGFFGRLANKILGQ